MLSTQRQKTVIIPSALSAHSQKTVIIPSALSASSQKTVIIPSALSANSQKTVIIPYALSAHSQNNSLSTSDTECPLSAFYHPTSSAQPKTIPHWSSHCLRRVTPLQVFRHYAVSVQLATFQLMVISLSTCNQLCWFSVFLQ